MIGISQRLKTGALAVMLGLAMLAGPASRGADPNPAKGEIVVTNVFDNLRTDTRLTARWGFAALISAGGTDLLFDTGADGKILLANMATLGIDPQRVDMVMISHTHSDHMGGLDRFLQENDRTRVFLPAGVPDSTRRKVAARDVEVRLIDAAAEIAPGIHSTGTLGQGVREQALVLETGEGLVVITGCAHPGIVEIVERARMVDPEAPVAMVMVGMHLREASDRQIDAIVAAFRALGVRKVAPSHCTGARAIERFRQAYGPAFVPAGAGTKLSFSLPADR